MVRRNTSRLPLWFRYAAIIIAFFLLFWLPIEDLDVRWVVLFAAAACTLAAARIFIALESSSNHRRLLAYPLLGMLAGLLAPPLAVFLMAFKGGLHGHPTPDFTSGQVISVLQRTPFWTIGGFLIGLGLLVFDKSGRH